MTARIARPARNRRAVAALDRRLNGNPHSPRQPEWTCRTCPAETPWPCPPARTRLAEAYRGNRVNLAMYLGALYAAALPELPTTPPGELRERFLGWTR